MSDSLFSPSWYRVADLKPRLRAHVKIHRHEYQGDVWYIIEDRVSERAHRFSPAAYHFIGLMDGKRTVQELWDLSGEHLGEQAPTQDEAIRLLGQLHAADALISDVSPDSRELFRRSQRHQSMQWKRRLWTPLAIRIPFWDPERFLRRTMPLVNWIFSWVGALIWLAVVAAGVVLAGVHWTEITEDVIDRAITPTNLLLLWVVYPLVKALHELGHAYAVKHWGGEVHEIGVMLLVLIPVPYVDASASTGFRDKRQRMVVAGAGIMVEVFLASLALFTWLNAEYGAIRAVAYNVMLIGGVSTLFFNGNPLLRFDGYYVLADAIEVPNLGTRSNHYWGYLFQRYLSRLQDAESKAHSNWERFWFVTYGVAGFVYRMMIVFVIILYIAGKFFTVGVILAIWATVTQLLVPWGKNLVFLFTNPKLKRRRKRAIGLTFSSIALVLLLFFAVPAPLWTRAEGVIWPPEQSQVRAGSDGFVSRVLFENQARVRQGDLLIEAVDPFLQSRLEVLEAQMQELRARLTAVQHSDRVQTAIIREEMAAVRAARQRTREKADALLIHSPLDGVLVVPGYKDLPGHYLRQGQVVAYVLDASSLSARVVVSQDDIGLVRQQTRGVEVMLADYQADPHPADILREVPGGSEQLPTPALGTGGGGKFAVDPSDPNARTTVERVFQLDVSLPTAVTGAFIGERVFVRFDHGWEPLGYQIYRSLRQLFLRRFGV